MALGAELKRLGKHSAIYGLGGLVSRILAVLLLPLYTRYLSPSDYGKVETLIALTTVIGIVLAHGDPRARSSASTSTRTDPARAAARRPHVVLVHDGRWRRSGLVVGLALRRADLATRSSARPTTRELVMAAFVGLWAGMNYEQLTSLFRVEERSVAFVSASLANILLTVGATLLLVVALDKGPIGVIVGNFTGTLARLRRPRRATAASSSGSSSTGGLLREMNRFGIPLVPTALFLWVTNFSDRLFLVKLADTTEVGLYSVGVRIASAMVLLLTAFRLAWPAFAYSIEDDGEARRTYAYVLTYLVARHDLGRDRRSRSSRRGSSQWIAAPAFEESSRVVGPLAFSTVAFAGYIVVAIGVGRAKRTQFNWVVTGAAAAVNIGLNLILIPPYGMMGAADRDDRRLRGDVRRDGVVVAAHLPGRRTSGGASSRRRRPGSRSSRSGSSPAAGSRSPLLLALALPARAAPARLLPAGRATRDRRVASASRAEL